MHTPLHHHSNNENWLLKFLITEKRILFSPMEKFIVNLIIDLNIVFLIITYTFVTQYET